MSFAASVVSVGRVSSIGIVEGTSSELSNANCGKPKKGIRISENQGAGYQDSGIQEGTNACGVGRGALGVQ